MFLPNNLENEADLEAKRRGKDSAKKSCIQLERWSMELIPRNARKGVIVSAQEVECSDPECSPIDTVVAIIFPK